MWRTAASSTDRIEAVGAVAGVAGAALAAAVTEAAAGVDAAGLAACTGAAAASRSAAVAEAAGGVAACTASSVRHCRSTLPVSDPHVSMDTCNHNCIKARLIYQKSAMLCCRRCYLPGMGPETMLVQS